MQTNRYDVVVVGAGIVGSLIARELSRYRLRIALVERADDIGTGASGANSAILHSGYDPEPGTLKASLNIRGSELWRDLAPELEVRHSYCGSLVVATNAAEVPTLRALIDRAAKNGVHGAQLLTRQETIEREPLITSNAVASLWTPTAGIVDPFGAVLAASESAVMNGVELRLRTEVTNIELNEDTTVDIGTTAGRIAARYVVNAAGVRSDQLLRMTGDRPRTEIDPRRGEYFALDPARVRVRTVLFPVPSDVGKGTLVTPTAFGNTMIGPNAHHVTGREDTRTSAEGLDEIFRNARNLVPAIDRRDVIASFAGVRASRRDGSDFLIELSRKLPRVVHLVGIESPGFVSAPAIAELAIELLSRAGLELMRRDDWTPRRPVAPSFRHLTHDERAVLVEHDRRYGRIVCRCQLVTEGELVAAIHGPIPAKTYDALKRRCWIGTGRCQGGFDYNRVISILSRELGVSAEEITKNGPGSPFVFRETKSETTAR